MKILIGLAFLCSALFLAEPASATTYVVAFAQSKKGVHAFVIPVRGFTTGAVKAYADRVCRGENRGQKCKVSVVTAKSKNAAIQKAVGRKLRLRKTKMKRVYR